MPYDARLRGLHRQCCRRAPPFACLRAASFEGIRLTHSSGIVLRERERGARAFDRQELSFAHVDYVSRSDLGIVAPIDVARSTTSSPHCRAARTTRSPRVHTAAEVVNLVWRFPCLELTCSFTKALSSPPSITSTRACVQAYLPTSHVAMEALCDVAGSPPSRRRHDQDTSVKGSNLAMEKVEAEFARLAHCPFVTKQTSTPASAIASTSRFGLKRGAERVGVASHNLFDVGGRSLVEAAERPKAHRRRDARSMANAAKAPRRSPEDVAVRAIGHATTLLPRLRISCAG